MGTKLVEILDTAEGQVVRLPEEFRFHTAAVSIRRQGNAIVLEPVKPTDWPEGFFEKIRIDDPNFARAEQGASPPALKLN
jgi:virulence-associated protein VagC